MTNVSEVNIMKLNRIMEDGIKATLALHSAHLSYKDTI
jgi:hypothetical protein